LQFCCVVSLPLLQQCTCAGWVAQAPLDQLLPDIWRVRLQPTVRRNSST
jgi:hypothetical protein